MYQKYEPLQSLLTVLTKESKISICIHDVSGITNYESFNLPLNFQIHSKPFCNIAKSTTFGYQLCTSCKMRANRKASRELNLFFGYCPYGIFEFVKPVVMDGKLLCIIYLGNLSFDLQTTKNKIHKACKITKVCEQSLLDAVNDIHFADNFDFYIHYINVIDSYIKFLHEKSKFEVPKSKNHWAVSLLKNYIESNFNQNITLKGFSKLYFVNEKYIGRLFKKQMEITFHEYLNNIRIENAVKLLSETDDNIINIAYQCGFQNVTYFNRVFLKKTKMTPTKFRKNIRSKK